MKNRSKIFSKLGLGLLTSSILLTACTGNQSQLKLDYEAVKDTELAKETANGKDVQMYDTSRPIIEDYSKVNENQAKYVFLFIGDGMGVTTVTAAENY